MVSYFGSSPTMFKRAEPLSNSAWPLTGILGPLRLTDKLLVESNDTNLSTDHLTGQGIVR